jgi:hypothetical protein
MACGTLDSRERWWDETPWTGSMRLRRSVAANQALLRMAKMTPFVRRACPVLGLSSCPVASLALRCGGSRGRWPARGGWLGLGLLLLGAVGGPARDAAAQQLDVQVNLPYAVQFGFGSYDVGGLSANVFRVPVKHTFALGPEKDAWRLVLTGYLGYGHFSFESSVFGPKITASEDFAFVLPQAELQIPLRRWWTVKPYVAAGLGRTFNASATVAGPPGGEFRVEEGFVFLYAAGISNLFEFQVQDFLLSVGTRLAGAGDATIGQSRSTNYGTLQNGLEVRHPLGFTVKNLVPDVGVSFIYYYFFPSAKFSLPGGSPLEVSNQFEVGINVGSAVPFTLWIIENPRIGVSYRFGDGLTGVRAQSFP